MRLRPASAPRDAAPPDGRPGRFYAGISATLATLRQRWFLLLGRDALLFLALTLAVVSLDNPQAVWMLWWPMPLALLACALTFVLHGASPARWRHMVNLGLFALPLAARVWLAYESPIRHAAVIEARELGTILLLGVAIWFVASCHPGRALGAWMAALAFGGAFCWNTLDRATRATGDPSFRALLIFTLGWGALAGLFLLRGALARRGAPPAAAAPARRFSIRQAAIDLLCLLCLGAGLTLGYFLYREQLNGPLRQAIPIQAGLAAQRELWLQSVLFGWGGWLLERLIQVVADPTPVLNPPWGGLPGALARGGVGGIIMMLVWSLALNRQVRRAPVSPYGQALGLPAAMGVFLLIGLFITGAPRSRLGALVLAGWVALALVKPIRVRYRKGRPLPPRIVPALALALMGGLLAIGLGFPALSRSLLKSASERRAPSLMRQDLESAEFFDWLNPAIPAAMAASFRVEAELGDTPIDDTYRKVVRYYQEAQQLDPYETAYPLALATFQLQTDREEEAFKTVEAALAYQPKPPERIRRPHAPELMSWEFGTALRFNQNAKADAILTRALAVSPMDGTWWQNQYTLARRLGQGPQAAQALAVALTGALEDHQLLVNAAFEAMPGEAAPAQGNP